MERGELPRRKSSEAKEVAEFTNAKGVDKFNSARWVSLGETNAGRRRKDFLQG